MCVRLLKEQSQRGFLSGDLTVYRFRFHHFVQHFHSHLELQGGTKQKDTNTSECHEMFVEEKWPLKEVCEVGWVSCTTCKAACERVSDNKIHICVSQLCHTCVPPQSSITITSPCGISDSDYRRVLWCTSKYSHCQTDRTGHESVAVCYYWQKRKWWTPGSVTVLFPQTKVSWEQYNHAFLC